ncbi:hypothetical protein [Halomonas sp. MS1]|nr:hypothetical protein [Halomonas sp. MS1]UTD55923.1 hypothetical protein NF683_01510 [Halomonas sp. MS1]
MITTATFGSRLITKRKLTAEKLVAEYRSGKNTKAKFVPPKIGASDFGYFEAKLEKPRYEVILD